MADKQDFGKANVSETLQNLSVRCISLLDDMETLLTLPIDYIKSSMDNNDFMTYVHMREQTIRLLELLEVFVYDTHEGAIKCVECGEVSPRVIKTTFHGKEVERLNGNINHWVTNGKIHHIFTCDACMRRYDKSTNHH